MGDPSGRKITDAATACVSEERSSAPRSHVRTSVAQLERRRRLLEMTAVHPVSRMNPAALTLTTRSTVLETSGVAVPTNARSVPVPRTELYVPLRNALSLRSQLVVPVTSSSHPLLTVATATSASVIQLNAQPACQLVQRTTPLLLPTQENAAQNTNASAEPVPAHQDQFASMVNVASVPTMNLNAAENTSAHQSVVLTKLESSTTFTPHGSLPLTVVRSAPVSVTRT